MAETLPMVPIIGLGLLFLELILPTKGVLGIVGFGIFIYGSFGLIDHPNPNLRVPLPTVLIVDAIVTALVLAVVMILYRGYTSKQAQKFDLIGRTGQVVEWDGANRRIEIDGAIWRAFSSTPLFRGHSVIVIQQDNLILHVTPVGDVK